MAFTAVVVYALDTIQQKYKSKVYSLGILEILLLLGVIKTQLVTFFHSDGSHPFSTHSFPSAVLLLSGSLGDDSAKPTCHSVTAWRGHHFISGVT